MKTLNPYSKFKNLSEPQEQEAWRKQRYIIIKLLKTSDKEEILKAAREKKACYVEEERS